MSIKTLTVAVQGRATRGGADELFSAIISSAGNAHTSTVTMRMQSSVSQWQALARGFLVFNPLTFPLPTGFIITGAVLNLTPGVIVNSFAQSFCITSASMAQPLVGTADTDYATTASSRTEYTSRVTIASMANGVASAFTFNATGISYLNTQYGAGNPIVTGVRYSGDVDQISPTHIPSTTDDINLISAAASLVLTYRVGPGHAVIELTGTLGNSADTVNASLFVVEVFT